MVGEAKRRLFESVELSRPHGTVLLKCPDEL